MSIQSEAILEYNLIKQLKKLKYEPIKIKDDRVLEQNLKTQIEKHNNITLSDSEFKRVLNHLTKVNQLLHNTWQHLIKDVIIIICIQ